MNETLKEAKAQYCAVEIPPELDFAVASAIRSGDRRRSRRHAARRSFAALCACCACFVLLVNVSRPFALAVSRIPVLSTLARVVTISAYSVKDEQHWIDVRLPALADTGNSELEQRINREIRAKIDNYLAAAEEEAQANRDAFLETGGKAEDFIPVIIDVNYDVKSQNAKTLSFLLSATQTQATAYTEVFCYNLNLETGGEITLADVLGPDWKARANAAIRDEIARRSAVPGNSYFDGSDGVAGFVSVSDAPKFYLTSAGNPVILFEKYEIAPGYMGMQEFEIQKQK